LDGLVKCRFANDTLRIKVLAKSGHTEINLIELPEAMLKLDAVKFMKTLDEFQGVAEQSAIADYLDRNEVKAEKVVKPAPKAKAPAKKAAPKAKATAKVAVDAELEDAPF
jgi:hypothetical protein